MYYYQLTKGVYKQQEYGIYTAYGIAVVKDNKKIKEYEDLFLTEKEAKSFIDLCNRNKVDYIHLPEILEDHLNIVA